MNKIIPFLLMLSMTTVLLTAQENEDHEKELFSSTTFSGLSFRSIGPALTSGRIGDFAVNPNNNSEYYIAVCSGGMWKTTNSGTTFEPIFDSENSYSIGCVTLDPNNEHVVWVGTGENNSQRSVSYGDGVYKSEDGGKSWNNMGLKKSEHIGKILVDPRESNVVYVAAQGPLWGPGGQRGLYKTTDAGVTWDSVLYISEYTGVSDIAFDPRDPDVIYASAYQRGRHVWTLINGGPESAIYKTTDAGKSWKKLTSGIPSGDLGRIGLAVSPVDPDYVYAIIEAEKGKSGFFRSTNRGATWKKMSDYIASSPQYYMEILADPVLRDRVYSMDTYSRVTNDGGKTFSRLSLKNRHVDDHALWIDPSDNSHIMIGGDGGIYETWDLDEWHYKANLPITQYYRVSVDNSEPFYYVYGGTQDNNSMGGPSQTLKADGIMNSDWFITVGGDGYETVIDPENPDIVYSQWQYGGLIRYDRKSGETITIKPAEKEGESAYRWNWDSPIIISPHKNTRLYFAANILFKTEDRGNSWEAVSPDLTRQLDRNEMELLDKVWSVDAVAKNMSTSQYGNIVSLTESPLVEGLIYVGTDDGLIQVTEDGGKNWKKIDGLPGVPELAYVSCLTASLHDPNTVYATFGNHKMADFKPYVLVSNDRGSSWRSITTGIPENHPVWSIKQDHVNPDLLFTGTEFGIFFTNNGGDKWIQLKSGIPTIAVKDIAIQQRENDVALGTFGRGFYILDDYTPLRTANEELLNKNAHIFPIKDALMFHYKRGLYGQGESLYKAKNPEFGATFTYYLKEAPKTKKAVRQEMEKELKKENKPIPFPSWDELRAEDNEAAHYLLFTITDEGGNVVRRLKKKPSKGISRITWDLSYSPYNAITSAPDKEDYETGSSTTLAIPGKYHVSMSLSVDGETTELVGPTPFNAVPLNNTTLPAADRNALVKFQRDLAEINRVMSGTIQTNNELLNNLKLAKAAYYQTPDANPDLLQKIMNTEKSAKEIKVILQGDQTLSSRATGQPPSLSYRVRNAISGLWGSTSSPTETQKENYEIAKKQLQPLLENLKKLIEVDYRSVADELDNARAPWTPGRIPKL
jgi:photosystem II stability/assembly factor-like uncharacterized protein